MKRKYSRQTSLAFGLGIMLGLVTPTILLNLSGDSTTSRNDVTLRLSIINAPVKL